MKEYRVVFISLFEPTLNIEIKINELAREGWIFVDIKSTYLIMERDKK